jgi:hypothetical protein
MSDFLPIPGHEPYTVNALGQVRSERNASKLLLSHDAKGRVTLRGNGKTAKFFVGELLDLAGFYHNGSDKEAVARAEETARDALQRLALAEAQTEKMKARLDKKDRANFLLLGIRADLTRRIERMEQSQPKPASKPGPKPKRGRPERRGVEPDSDADPLFAEEW